MTFLLSLCGGPMLRMLGLLYLCSPASLPNAVCHSVRSRLEKVGIFEFSRKARDLNSNWISTGSNVVSTAWTLGPSDPRRRKVRVRSRPSSGLREKC